MTNLCPVCRAAEKMNRVRIRLSGMIVATGHKLCRPYCEREAEGLLLTVDAHHVIEIV